MADPHNPKRYGETWDALRIAAYLTELEKIKPHIILSGGWAWHFMSPKGHTELKHAHDHKDVDIFVHPNEVATVIPLLMGMGFEKVKTRFDKMPSDEEFRRYEKTVDAGKLTIDMFVKNVPFIMVDGWRLVEPKYLTNLYSTIHSSKSCFAVVSAEKIIAKGESPVNRPELVAIPKET